MKALVLKSPRSLEVMDVPLPVLRPGEILVRVSRCGVCGSDIRYFHGENPWARQTLQKDVPNPPNIIFGHEFVGTVEKVSDARDEHLLGKRVGLQTWTACGRCEHCRRGRENFCRQTRHLGHGQGWGKMDFYPGGMAEFCPAFAAGAYDLPENVSDEQATFLDPLTAAIHAVDVGGSGLLDAVVVLGAGPIGLMIAQLAIARGAAEVFITDVAERNLDVARQLGIRHTLNVSDKKSRLREWVMDTTGGRGVDRVFNTVGSNASIVESLEILAPAGVVVLMVTKEPKLQMPSLLLSGERTIKTSTNAMNTDLPRAIELIARGLVRVEPLITHRFPLTQGVKAFDVACNKDKTGAIKVILDCQS
jgi:threonine dehydrogenase-like Zn-dependent dehydrogenase